MVYLKYLFTLLSLLFVFQVSASEQINPDDIGEIIGRSNLINPSDVYQITLDTMVNKETVKIGQNNINWSPTNPKWNVVFNRIHDDLENTLQTTNVDERSVLNGNVRDYELAIVSHLKPSDVVSILTFYKTNEGKKYKAFIYRINNIFTLSSLVNLSSNIHPRQAGNNLTFDQAHRFNRMTQLSQTLHTTQSIFNVDKTSKGSESVTWTIIDDNWQLMKQLDDVFGDDLSKFEAFNQTDAEQHLIKALDIINTRIKNTSVNEIATLQAAINKHEGNWQEFYKSQMTQ